MKQGIVGDGFEGALNTGEIISLRSIRPKAIVDAELHRLDGLLDVNAWHYFGDTSNRPGQ